MSMSATPETLVIIECDFEMRSEAMILTSDVYDVGYNV